MNPNPYQEQLQALFGMRRTTRRRDLQEMHRMLQALQLQDLPYPVVQIVGTNGKGSTSAFLASILQRAGYRVGLFTSPHLIHFNERFQINGQVATDETLASLLNHTLDVAAHEEWEPVFFDVTTLMAAQYFAQEKVDIALFEAGMGGKLDATTALPSALSILTTVGLDHVPLLGNNLAEIAKDKAAAFRSNTPALVGVQDPEVLQVIQDLAQENQVSPLLVLGRDFPIVEETIELGLHGQFQRNNASLALGALGPLKENLGFSFSEESVQEGLSQARWPGRCQPVRYKEQTFWLDGAHNAEAMEALAQHFHGQPLSVVFGAMKDKDILALLRPLEASLEHLVLCPIQQPRAASPQELHLMLQELGWTNTQVMTTQRLEEALETAHSMATSSNKKNTLLVTGSLFLVGEVLTACGALDSAD
ncbi:MAG: bifunctional folylpolyglutamate synthase/dihydrofolate synthase [Deltaproteobacteria bacterium]|nr:MAG: bifunctional folylpolyglutamate synthase/dihydrofolate synthase [Deltaproteobacteria bacterium]